MTSFSDREIYKVCLSIYNLWPDFGNIDSFFHAIGVF